MKMTGTEPRPGLEGPRPGPRVPRLFISGSRRRSHTGRREGLPCPFRVGSLQQGCRDEEGGSGTREKSRGCIQPQRETRVRSGRARHGVVPCGQQRPALAPGGVPGLGLGGGRGNGSAGCCALRTPPACSFLGLPGVGKNHSEKDPTASSANFFPNHGGAGKRMNCPEIRRVSL